MKLKNFFLLVGFLFSSVNINAQISDNWFTNKDDAITFAKQNDTKILMIFAGSDWCRPCIQLKKDVLETVQFKIASAEKLSILYLDFPAKKKNKLSEELTSQNEALAAVYNVSGTFPKLVLFDSNFIKIKDINYKGENQEQFLKMINE